MIRSALIAASIFVAAPVAAEPVAAPASEATASSPAPTAPAARPHMPDLATSAAILSNPFVQEAAATFFTQLAGAVLQTRVAPFVQDPARRAGVGPDTTFGDLAKRRDPNYMRRLHDGAVQAMAAAGQAAQQTVAMRAELRATADRLRAVIGQAQAATGALK